MPDVNLSQDLVISKIAPILSNAQDILDQNRNSSLNAGAAVDKMEARLSAAPGGIISEQDDQDAEALIVNLNKTVEKMYGKRTPITQMMTLVAKSFTEEEGKFPAMIVRIKKFRDSRATYVIQENRRIAAEAEQKRLKGLERAELAGRFAREIAGVLNGKLFARKNELNALFDALTLEDIDQRGAKIPEITILFPGHKRDEFLKGISRSAGRYHSAAEVEVLFEECKENYDFDTFFSDFSDAISLLKQELIDKLPTKKAALLEKDRMEKEEQRLAAERKRQQEEEQRLVAERQYEKNEARRIQLEKEAAELKAQQDAQKEQEETLRQERQRQQVAEQKRLQVEAERRQLEEAAKAKESEDKAKLVQAQETGRTLFDQAASGNVMAKTARVRENVTIEVLNAAGYVEIFTYWYQNNAAELWSKDPADFAKVTLGKMVKFCEAQYKKEGIAIESPNLKYVESVSTVAQSQKKPA